MIDNPNFSTHLHPLLGLVVCGGESLRMGQDKSSLKYHQNTQRRVVQDLLRSYCEIVALSCNRNQEITFQKEGIVLADHPEYCNIGPMAALLTAQHHYPKHHILLIGCDYPLFDQAELENFLSAIGQTDRPCAFFNSHGFYEPLLGFYPTNAITLLMNQYNEGTYSLQYFLKQNGAQKHHPIDSNHIESVDTPEQYKQIISLINASSKPLKWKTQSPPSI